MKQVGHVFFACYHLTDEKKKELIVTKISERYNTRHGKVTRYVANVEVDDEAGGRLGYRSCPLYLCSGEFH